MGYTTRAAETEARTSAERRADRLAEALARLAERIDGLSRNLSGYTSAGIARSIATDARKALAAISAGQPLPPWPTWGMAAAPAETGRDER